MRWFKAALAGVLASVLMSIVMKAFLAAGVAPFNQPPSAAFLEAWGAKVGPLPVVMHLGYGAFWALLFLRWFGPRGDMARALALALGVLALYLVVLTPMIGWGVLGIDGPGHRLPAADPLYLGSAGAHFAISFAMHVVYGVTLGLLFPRWVLRPAGPAA